MRFNVKTDEILGFYYKQSWERRNGIINIINIGSHRVRKVPMWGSHEHGITVGMCLNSSLTGPINPREKTKIKLAKKKFSQGGSFRVYVWDISSGEAILYESRFQNCGSMDFWIGACGGSFEDYIRAVAEEDEVFKTYASPRRTSNFVAQPEEYTIHIYFDDGIEDNETVCTMADW